MKATNKFMAELNLAYKLTHSILWVLKASINSEDN
mgnify:CR=1 FL=1